MATNGSAAQKAVEEGIFDEETASSLLERAYELSRVIVAGKE